MNEIQSHFPTRAILGAVTWMVFATSNVNACNIPVFRYALERWKPDACEVYVFYDQDLSAEHERKVQSWQSLGAEMEGPANLELTRCAIGSGELDASARKLWDSVRELPGTSLPHVVVRTSAGRRWINHWHGSMAEAAKLPLLDSPARKELKQRLLAGHSVVWLVVHSGPPERTKAVNQLLKDEFKRLEKIIAIPEGVGLPGSELHSEIPLLVKFSAMEIDARDEREQYLTSLLKGMRPKAFSKGEPLVVPVFGRGRALEVIPAEELDARLMEDLTRFLGAACSCQVKEQNPGFDLLITADWDTELFGEDGVRPPPAKRVGDRVKSPVQLTIPPGR